MQRQSASTFFPKWNSSELLSGPVQLGSFCFNFVNCTFHSIFLLIHLFEVIKTPHHPSRFVSISILKPEHISKSVQFSWTLQERLLCPSFPHRLHFTVFLVWFSVAERIRFSFGRPRFLVNAGPSRPSSTSRLISMGVVTPTYVACRLRSWCSGQM